VYIDHAVPRLTFAIEVNVDAYGSQRRLLAADRLA
jgi:hypothetical protein